MHEKVARLRQLMSEALPQSKAALVFPCGSFGLTENSKLLQSPRARSIRRIIRIVEANQWPQVLEMALDQAEATSLAELSDSDVANLLCHLESLEDCMDACADSNFSPRLGGG